MPPSSWCGQRSKTRMSWDVWVLASRHYPAMLTVVNTYVDIWQLSGSGAQLWPASGLPATTTATTHPAFPPRVACSPHTLHNPSGSVLAVVPHEQVDRPPLFRMPHGPLPLRARHRGGGLRLPLELAISMDAAKGQPGGIDTPSNVRAMDPQQPELHPFDHLDAVGHADLDGVAIGNEQPGELPELGPTASL